MKRLRDDDDGGGVGLDLGSKKAKGCGGESPSSSSTYEVSPETALAYYKFVRKKLGDRTDLFDKFKLLLLDFRHGTIDAAAIISQTKILFRGYDDLICGFNRFLPREYEISPEEAPEDDDDEEEEDDDSDRLKFGGKFEALRFVNKVKVVFGGGDKYKAFLDVWYGNGDLESKYNEGARLLGGQSDLLEEFDSLLGRNPPAPKSSDDDSLNLSYRFSHLLYHERQMLCNADYRDLLKKVHDHSLKLISRDDLEAAVTHHPNLLQFIKDQNLRNFEEEKKEIKSVHELHLSKRISYSYWVLPEEYHVATVGEEDEDGVLNGELFCMSPEDSDYSFKHRQLQQHEQVLFKLEDDRCEIDVLQGNIESAINKVKKLLESTEEKRINLDSNFKIEHHLSVLNRRCIERLYGDHGLEMMQVLNKKPIEALRVILDRLEQKLEELKSYRRGFNRICGNILPKKSVDTQKEESVIGNEQAADLEQPHHKPCFVSETSM